jgi:hypothetical protein
MTLTAPDTKTTLNDNEFLIIDGQLIVLAEEAVHIVNVNPRDAQLLLDRSDKNRLFNQSNFKKLVATINDGDFAYNGSSLCLSAAGRLLDGQHRLRAIIATGITAKFIIATGIVDKAQSTMDTGRSRTLAQNLQMNGEQYENELSGALIGIQAWELGERATQVSLRDATIQQSLRFYAAHPEVRDISREAKNYSRAIPGLSCKAISQFIWAFDKIDATERKAFFDLLVSGVGLSEGDPILQLRNYLHTKVGKEKLTAHQLSGMTCKAWNQWREGDRKRLAFRPGGSNPEAFPEPR